MLTDSALLAEAGVPLAATQGELTPAQREAVIASQRVLAEERHAAREGSRSRGARHAELKATERDAWQRRDAWTRRRKAGEQGG